MDTGRHPTLPSHTFLAERVTLHVGDITCHVVDAIVNAANSSLLGGGGVDGAIHRAGGPEVTAACRHLRETTLPDGLPTGEAVITTGGRLPAKHVIHTVGPIYGHHGGKETELLAACYRNSLKLAARHGLHSIAFPSISTGVYRFPREMAAGIVSDALTKCLAELPSIHEARLVFFQDQDLQIFLANHRF